MTLSEYNISVKEYADPLYRYAYKLVGNQMDAEDVVQTVYEKLWLKKDNIEFDRIKGLMFKIAHNHVMDQFRKKKVQRKHVNQLNHESYDISDSIEASDILKHAFKNLTEEQKSLILLRDYEGYPYEEIAEMLEMSLSQVKVYLFRARKQLQQAIKALELSK